MLLMAKQRSSRRTYHRLHTKEAFPNSTFVNCCETQLARVVLLEGFVSPVLWPYCSWSLHWPDPEKLYGGKKLKMWRKTVTNNDMIWKAVFVLALVMVVVVVVAVAGEIEVITTEITRNSTLCTRRSRNFWEWDPNGQLLAFLIIGQMFLFPS